jgi:hypothetical protein
MPLNVGAGSSGSYSAYGLKVKENEQLYNQYLGAYKDVLAGVQNVGNAQRQAITDFYAKKQGDATQSLISRGLSNSTVTDSISRGLTLDEGKAQNDLAERVARMRGDYGSQMAQGLHAFMGGYSESASRQQQPSFGGGMAGFSNAPLNFGGGMGRVPFGGGGGGGGFVFGGYPTGAGSLLGGIPAGGGGMMGGDFAGLQGDFGVPFTPSGTVGEGGAYDQFGVPSGMPGGYDESAYAWA